MADMAALVRRLGTGTLAHPRADQQVAEDDIETNDDTGVSVDQPLPGITINVDLRQLLAALRDRGPTASAG